jgi:glycolate oxidase
MYYPIVLQVTGVKIHPEKRGIVMLIQELKDALGEDKVLTEDFERYVYGADWSPRTKDEIFPPDVVIVPKTTDDVAEVVKIAYKHGIPVTAGGGLTGMAGGAVPINNGIYIDSTRME